MTQAYKRDIQVFAQPPAGSGGELLDHNFRTIADELDGRVRRKDTDQAQAPLMIRPHPAVTNPILTPADVTDGNNVTGVADPFVVYHNTSGGGGQYIMFFEVMDADGEHIAIATSFDGVQWEYDGIILADDGAGSRFAFPHVFRVGNDWYMTPDKSGGNDNFEIWRATSFPDQWELAETPLTSSQAGHGFADTVPWFWQGRWYFTTFAYDTTGDIRLYVADEGESIIGRTWTEHSQSPILASSDHRRNGGGAWVYENHIDVVFQGQANQDVRLARFTHLTPTQVSVFEPAGQPFFQKSDIPSDWRNTGAHHADWPFQHFGTRQIVVVDGRVGGEQWTIGLYEIAPGYGFDTGAVPFADVDGNLEAAGGLVNVRKPGGGHHGSLGVGTNEQANRRLHVYSGASNEAARFETNFPIIELKNRLSSGDDAGGAIHFLTDEDEVNWRVGSRLTVGERNFEIVDAVADVSRLYITPEGTVIIGGGLDLDGSDILQVRSASFEQVLDNGNSGSSATIDFELGNKQEITLTADTVDLTLVAPPGPASLQLVLKQDATGGRSVDWQTPLLWPGGQVQALTPDADAVDIVSLLWDGNQMYATIAKDFR